MAPPRMVALDLSLTATGIAWTCDHHGRASIGARTVHTARTAHGVNDIDHRRLNVVLADVAAAVKCRPELVVIEWLPGFAGHGDVTIRLAELHGVIKHWLWVQKIPYVDVHPPELKIWATGKGTATKTAVKERVIATYGGLCNIADDNQADAMSLLSLACAAYGEPLARVVNPNQTRAIKNVTWPTLGGAR